MIPLPTIKDIAKEAGVSHGTVSNVLNKTGKVSAEKIRLVEEAAKRLGYKVNVQAQLLRQGMTKSICVILPSLRFKHYNNLFRNIREELTASGYEVTLYTTNGISSIEHEIWNRILLARPDAIICVSCLEEIPDAYLSDCPVVFIDRVLSPHMEHVFSASFDFEAAGQDIANYAISKGYQNLALFTESGKPSGKRLLYDSLKKHLPAHVALSRFSSDDQLILGKAFEITGTQDTFDAIITTNTERAESIVRAAAYAPVPYAPDIITLSSLETFPDSRFCCYELNYPYMGRETAIQLTGFLNGRTMPQRNLAFTNHGFYASRHDKAPASKEPTVLNMLTLESPATTALYKLLPDFTRRTGITVHMTVLSFDELYDTIRTMGNSGYFDLIRMDMAWLSHLAKETYLPLNELPVDMSPIIDGFIPEINSSYLEVEQTPYCLPFDPSTQMLFYRKDLFQDAMVKRQYYEQFREELTVPCDFPQYNRIASFFTKSIHPASPVSYGSTLTFGTSGVAACDYLPRLLAFSGSFFDEAGRLSLCSEHALNALESYMETYEYTDKSINMWWKHSMERFSSGNTAMTTVFMNHASDLINSKHSNVIGKIGYSMIPGANPLLGGGVIGISRASHHATAACRFFEWVYSDETAGKLTLLGGLSPNRSIYENREITSLFPWLESCRTSFAHGSRRKESSYYPKFNEKQFENILGAAVRSAVTRTIPPREALEYALTLCEKSFC